MNLRLIVLCSFWLASVASAQTWVGSWGASPLPPSPGGGPFPATRSFSDQTVRQIVRLSTGGDAVRLRLSNEYGTSPLEIGAARVGLAGGNGAVVPGSDRVVTFAGKPSATIPAGAPLLSDAIDLEVDDLAILSVSLYFPGDTGPCTCHQTGMQTAFVSSSGDHTSGSFEAAETIEARAFLSGVEVLADDAQAVVVLGDSISDGVGSTPGANRRWPDLLAERLNGRDPGSWGVVNHGISGNRVLNDGAGESALARFDRDVLSVPGVTHIIVFEGVNDLGIGYGDFGGFGGLALPQGVEASLDNMIGGYRQLIARAHARGLQVFGATIAPYEGAAYWSAEGEAVRVAINDWIRDSDEFDAVLDFDAVFRDPEKKSSMRDGLHSGDFLHGSDAGYRVVADSIDLELFR
jgi:lysophospholipase L1-like esterase